MIRAIKSGKEGFITRKYNMTGGNKNKFLISKQSIKDFKNIMNYYLVQNYSYEKSLELTHRELNKLIKQSTNKQIKDHYISTYYLYINIFSELKDKNPTYNNKKIHKIIQKNIINKYEF